MSTKSIKLPKNFASQILDQEYKVDSGACNFESVNTLLQMYSVSFVLILTHFAAGRRVLLRHQRREVHLLHRAHSKPIVSTGHSSDDELPQF